MKRFDHDLGGSIDEQRVMFYSAPGSWQLLEERVCDGWTPGSPDSVDRIIQYVWGIPVGGYTRDITMRRYNQRVHYPNSNPPAQ